MKIAFESLIEGINETQEKNHEPSKYARCIDTGCAWVCDNSYSSVIIYLKHVELLANDFLRAKGKLYLNDVYEMLGLPKSKEGSVAGWIYNEGLDMCSGYIEFVLYDSKNVTNFINGHELKLLIDFNVDGYIG